MWYDLYDIGDIINLTWKLFLKTSGVFVVTSYGFKVKTRLLCTSLLILLFAFASDLSQSVNGCNYLWSLLFILSVFLILQLVFLILFKAFYCSHHVHELKYFITDITTWILSVDITNIHTVWHNILCDNWTKLNKIDSNLQFNMKIGCWEKWLKLLNLKLICLDFLF